ncbi:MAG: flavodoxin [Clostridiales bacterium]|nr:flavodoxin [Clostridiales bacterium]
MNRKMVIIVATVAIIAVISGLTYYFINNISSQENKDTQMSSENTANTETEKATKNTSNEADLTDEETTSSSSKILVVYYSATNNTQRVAQTIAENTEADIFEIEPAEPYTDDDLDWTDENSRVSLEHNNESLRNVELISTAVDNWSDYDTVFIGYPIWWGIAAWPVNNFISDNDFTGKTVIPFCTSASSGLGQSGELLEEMAGTGNWQDGMRFSSSASDSEIADWIDERNL